MRCDLSAAGLAKIRAKTNFKDSTAPFFSAAIGCDADVFKIAMSTSDRTTGWHSPNCGKLAGNSVSPWFHPLAPARTPAFRK